MEWKISVASAHFYDMSPEDMILEYEKAGYNYSELAVEHGKVLFNRGTDIEKTGREFMAFAKAHNVSFTQGHLPMELIIAQNPEDFELMKKYIDLYEALGVKHCVYHARKVGGEEVSAEESEERNIAALIELKEYIKDKDIVICVENVCKYNTTAQILNRMLDRVDDERHFAICFDTGHANVVGADCVEFIKEAGSRIKALHIADNPGPDYGDLHMMPCGKGSIDFVPVFRELMRVGYDQIYNLEIGGESWNVPLDVRRLKLKYIKEMMTYLLDEAAKA